MPTRPVRLPGSLTGRRKPVDTGHLHWCSETCVHVTPLERKIVEMISAGHTNAAIAKRLQITEHGVRNHVSGIMAKLNVVNRTQLAVVALQTRLIDGSAPE